LVAGRAAFGAQKLAWDAADRATAVGDAPELISALLGDRFIGVFVKDVACHSYFFRVGRQPCL